MSQPEFEQAIAFALDLLHRELAPELTYHNLWHTRDDVMVAAVAFGQLSRLEAEDLDLLRVAAAFHDVGFVSRYQGHEIASMRIAAQELPQFGFRPDQIEQVIGMIMATRLPQSPRSHLEALLADADLDVLGRDDFFTRNQALRAEHAAFGRRMTDGQWLQQQRDFLQGHRYFTAVARSLRTPTKRTNLALLEAQIAVELDG